MEVHRLKRFPVVPADRPGTCPRCDARWGKGDPIGLPPPAYERERRWLCEHCADRLWDAYADERAVA